MKLKSKSEAVFGTVNNILMALVIVVMLYPMLNQVAISFSGNAAIMAGKVNLIPKDVTTVAYKEILADKNFVTAMKNTVLYTVVATLLQVFLTMLFSYPLSKKNLKGRNIIMTLLVFSMMFGTGGLIPNYILIQKLGLVNTYGALILPGAINIWNVIVFKNFFQQLPESLEEAAKVDGAGIWRIFAQIVIPLSKPVIAAIGLFTAVAAWSTFFNCMLYITSPEKKLLQVYLNDILQSNIVPVQQTDVIVNNTIEETTNSDALKAACLICTLLPVTMIYPFVQKYFMAGMMMGSVKG